MLAAPSSHPVATTATTAPLTPATLFSDGLASIFAYCDNRSWLSSSRVSHYWFSVASRLRVRQLRVKRTKIRDGASLAAYLITGDTTLSTILPELKEDKEGIPCHNWSLRHHLTQMRMCDLRWCDINRQLADWFIDHTHSSPSSFTSFSSAPPSSSSFNIVTSILQLHLSVVLPPLAEQMVTTPPTRFPNSLTDLKLTIKCQPQHASSVGQLNSPLDRLFSIMRHSSLTESLQQLDLNIQEYDREKKGSATSAKQSAPTSSLPIIDWSPLCAFRHLHTLTIRDPFRKVPTHSPSTSTRLIPCCGQLPQLTHLKLDTLASPHNALEDISLLIQPRLRLLALPPFPQTEELLSALHQVQPLIEEPFSDDDHSIDFMTLTRLFTHIRRLELWQEYDETIVSALAQASALEELCFYYWSPILPESYVRLSSRLTRLNHLRFGSSEPIRLMCHDGAALEGGGCHSLITRLTSLGVRHDRILTEELLEKLAHFTSLTQLHAHYGHESTNVEANIEYYSLYYDLFNTPSFLPRLHTIKITEADDTATRFLIDYDYKKGINKCEFHQFIIHKFLDDELAVVHNQIRVGHNPLLVLVTPPQAPLVGIELNPGPTPAASSNDISLLVTMSASNLFTDGLRIIFSCLPARDFVHAASASRYWFRVASESTINLNVATQFVARRVQPLSTARTRVNAPTEETMTIISTATTSIEQQQRQQQQQNSPWSLDHLVTYLALNYYTSWCALSQCLSQYRHLHTLVISSLHDEDEVISIVTTSIARHHNDLHLPYDTLTSLTIVRHLSEPSSTNPWGQQLIDNVGRCVHLQHLHLSGIDFRFLSPMSHSEISNIPFSFTRLYSLTQLRVLHIYATFTASSLHGLCKALGAMNLLTDLTLKGSLLDRLTPADIRVMRLPLLRRIFLSCQLLYPILQAMSEVMPRLEEIAQEEWSSLNLTGLTLFPHMRTIQLFTLRDYLGEDDRISTSEQEIITILCSSCWTPSLTYLRFIDFPLSQSGWTSISSTLSSLTSLYLVSPGPLPTLTQNLQSTDLMNRITSLILREKRLTLRQVDELRTLSYFLAVKHLDINFTHIDAKISPRDIYQLFNEATFMPQLAYFKFTSRIIHILYDPASHMNHVNLDDGKWHTEEEKTLHRTTLLRRDAQTGKYV